jgi:hypothetical protein
MMLGGMRHMNTITILSIKINSISHNASVNIGESLHNSHSANSKSTGMNSSYGDYTPTSSNMRNIYIDPDVNDQNEVGVNDIVRSNQV